jgi:hypothetical protein
MEAREQRGLEIAATKKLRQKGELWIVPSATGTGSYVVEPNAHGSATCTCPTTNCIKRRANMFTRSSKRFAARRQPRAAQ